MPQATAHAISRDGGRQSSISRKEQPAGRSPCRSAIERQFALLATSPEIGRPLADLPQLHELLIGFGDSDYVALYRHDPSTNAVYVLAFRQQKQAGY